MDAKISVLMGIYNCAKTLPEAIDSILAQTYENWELILCEDGSQDDTYAVAKVYADRYPEKIVLLQNEKNMGLNHTLNRCLAVASGDFAARMDGDDRCEPCRFEAQLKAFDDEPDLAVVSSSMSFFDESGTWSAAGPVCVYPRKEMLVYGTVHCHAPCMIRMDVLRQVGGYGEEKKLLRVEDWHLWLKIYAAGYRGKNLEQPLYAMRDDRNAAGRRKFRYRLHEAYVSALAVKMLSLPVWYYVFSLRPILVGVLPAPVYRYLHRKKWHK